MTYEPLTDERLTGIPSRVLLDGLEAMPRRLAMAQRREALVAKDQRVGIAASLRVRAQRLAEWADRCSGAAGALFVGTAVFALPTGFQLFTGAGFSLGATAVTAGFALGGAASTVASRSFRRRGETKVDTADELQRAVNEDADAAVADPRFNDLFGRDIGTAKDVCQDWEKLSAHLALVLAFGDHGRATSIEDLMQRTSALLVYAEAVELTVESAPFADPQPGRESDPPDELGLDFGRPDPFNY